MNELSTRILCLASILALLLGATASTAAARPGDLDRSFGDGGRVLTPIRTANRGGSFETRAWLHSSVATALGPNGEIAVAGERTVAVYLADGQPDRRFGNRGKVSIEPPADGQIVIEDVLIDAERRVVVVATAWALASKAVATIIRYQPNGRLDQGFGTGGVLQTDFGLPTPLHLSALGSTPAEPAVMPKSAAIDAQGRIVIAGAARAFVGACRGAGDVPHDRGFVGRLTPTGALDPTFGNRGVAVDSEVAWIGEVALYPDGGPIYAGDLPGMCNGFGGSVLVRLDGGGLSESAFGAEGMQSISPDESRPRRIAIDRRGRILVLRDASSQEAEYRSAPSVLTRFSRDGTPDVGFGERLVQLPGEESRLNALAVDESNRPLLAGKLASARSSAEARRGIFPRARFVVIRLRATGGLDRRFGRKGRVATRFGVGSKAAATDLLVDGKRRLVVAGPATGQAPSPHRRFALARYELGP